MIVERKIFSSKREWHNYSPTVQILGWFQAILRQYNSVFKLASLMGDQH